MSYALRESLLGIWSEAATSWGYRLPGLSFVGVGLR
jgi:hypothetical protein